MLCVPDVRGDFPYDSLLVLRSASMRDEVSEVRSNSLAGLSHSMALLATAIYGEQTDKKGLSHHAVDGPCLSVEMLGIS